MVCRSMQRFYHLLKSRKHSTHIEEKGSRFTTGPMNLNESCKWQRRSEENKVGLLFSSSNLHAYYGFATVHARSAKKRPSSTDAPKQTCPPIILQTRTGNWIWKTSWVWVSGRFLKLATISTRNRSKGKMGSSINDVCKEVAWWIAKFFEQTELISCMQCGWRGGNLINWANVIYGWSPKGRWVAAAIASLHFVPYIIPAFSAIISGLWRWSCRCHSWASHCGSGREYSAHPGKGG